MLACTPPFSQLLWPNFEPLCAAFLKGKSCVESTPTRYTYCENGQVRYASGKGPYCLRILLHGINYSPELTGIGKYSGEMAEWLAAPRGRGGGGFTAPNYFPA